MIQTFGQNLSKKHLWLTKTKLNLASHHKQIQHVEVSFMAQIEENLVLYIVHFCIQF